MKKLFALLLALVMVLSLAACGGEKPVESNPLETDPPAQTQPAPTETEPAETDPVETDPIVQDAPQSLEIPVDQ